MSEHPHDRKITVTAIFGRDTNQPLVNLVLPDHKDRVSMHVDEARALAHNLLQAAEASLGDGFVVGFFMREMGLSIEEAGPLMVKFRGYRTSHEPAGR